MILCIMSYIHKILNTFFLTNFLISNTTAFFTVKILFAAYNNSNAITIVGKTKREESPSISQLNIKTRSRI